MKKRGMDKNLTPPLCTSRSINFPTTRVLKKKTHEARGMGEKRMIICLTPEMTLTFLFQSFFKKMAAANSEFTIRGWENGRCRAERCRKRFEKHDKQEWRVNFVYISIGRPTNLNKNCLNPVLN